MRKLVLVLFVLIVLGFGTNALAAIDLLEYSVNKDGSFSTPAPGSFNTATGLGSITATVSGAGNHYVAAFFDHDITDPNANLFSNEFGFVHNLANLAAGQSWEIDEPGHSTSYTGDIFDNFGLGTLDGTVFNSTLTLNGPDDVSMAIGWDFILAAGETATITFTIGTDPFTGFYLEQNDPDSLLSIYLKSGMTIQGGGTQVPEPGTMLLLATGLIGIMGVSRKVKL